MPIDRSVLAPAVAATKATIAAYKQGEYTDLRSKIILAEADAVIQQLSDILDNTAEENLAEALSQFLAQRWDNIAGSFLGYTCLPESDMTQLCLTVAKALHAHDPSRKVYQYLMPTLTGVVDVIEEYEDNIDDLSLAEVVLAEDQRSLIPVRVMLGLNPETGVGFEHLRKPYVADETTEPEPFTEKEQQALIQHSSISHNLYEAYTEILAFKSESASIGGMLHRLIQALRRGGVHGQEGGTEGLASTSAYEGIRRFMHFWHSLDDATRERVGKLRAKADSPKNIQDVINILIKVDDQGFDCVEVNADYLEKVVNAHPELYQESEFSESLYEKYQTDFSSYQQQLETSAKGQDVGIINAYGLQYALDNIRALLDDKGFLGLLKLTTDNFEFYSEVVIALCASEDLLTLDDFNQTDDNGDNCLHWAVKQGLTGIVQAILQRNHTTAFINRTNNEGEAPLHLAAYAGQLDMVNLILEHNASADIINFPDADGHSSLALAFTEAAPEIALAILRKNAGPDVVTRPMKTLGDEDKTPLLFAAELGYADVVSYLLEQHSELAEQVTAKGLSALHLAAKEGHTDVVAAVLNQSRELLASLDKAGNTPLLTALEKGEEDVAITMLEKASEEPLFLLLNQKNNKGFNALSYIVTKGYSDTFSALGRLNLLQTFISASVDDTADILFLAIEKNNQAVIDTLLSLELPPEVWEKQNKQGLPLLLWVCEKGNRAIVEKILTISPLTLDDFYQEYTIKTRRPYKGGKNTNKVSKNLLRYISNKENFEVGQLLLDKIVELCATDNARLMSVMTELLWLAVSANNPEIVKRILSLPGVDVRELLSAKNKAGETPLLLAVKKDYATVVRHLLTDGEQNRLSPADNVALLTAQHGEEKQTLLHVAVASDSRDCVYELLAFNSSTEVLNVKNKQGNTAWMEAVKSKKAYLYMFFQKISDPDLINIKNNEGIPLLGYLLSDDEFASKTYNIDVIMALEMRNEGPSVLAYLLAEMPDGSDLPQVIANVAHCITRVLKSYSEEERSKHLPSIAKMLAVLPHLTPGRREVFLDKLVKSMMCYAPDDKTSLSEQFILLYQMLESINGDYANFFVNKVSVDFLFLCIEEQAVSAVDIILRHNPSLLQVELESGDTAFTKAQKVNNPAINRVLIHHNPVLLSERENPLVILYEHFTQRRFFQGDVGKQKADFLPMLDCLFPLKDDNRQLMAAVEAQQKYWKYEPNKTAGSTYLEQRTRLCGFNYGKLATCLQQFEDFINTKRSMIDTLSNSEKGFLSSLDRIVPQQENELSEKDFFICKI